MSGVALGVGVIYNGVIDEALKSVCVDYLTITPERFWVDRGRGVRPRYHRPPGPAIVLAELADRHRLVAHGLGLSIASASIFDVAHVRQLARLHREIGFQWISEHLMAVRVATSTSTDHHGGVQIPLPWDKPLLRLMVRRIDRVQQLLGSPLLLENGVEFTPVPDCGMNEVEFMNELQRQTGCRYLVDVHNLYCNHLNLGIDPNRWMSELEPDSVEEIHIAGGNRMNGAWLDSHAGACPEPVWDLLDTALARFPRVRGVAFEFHESYFPELTAAGLQNEIGLARDAWARRDRARDVAA
jgi:uncharacterized protein